MKSNQAGMTIIELMLSILLFVIVFTCSLVILNKAVGVTTDTSNLLKAICITNQQMESVKCLKYDDLKNRTFVIDKFKGEITIKDYEEGLKEVIVTTKWQGSIGIPKQVRVVTLVAKRE